MNLATHASMMARKASSSWIVVFVDYMNMRMAGKVSFSLIDVCSPAGANIRLFFC